MCVSAVEATRDSRKARIIGLICKKKKSYLGFISVVDLDLKPKVNDDIKNVSKSLVSLAV